MGLDPGRYLARAASDLAGGEDDAERVLVVEVAGAPLPPRRRLGRAKPKRVKPRAGVPSVPLTVLTAIRPEALGDERSAGAWLGRLRDDPDAVAAEIDAALRLVNRAIHAHRTAVLDHAAADVSAAHALAVRIGYGDGEQLADGRFAEALEVPPSSRPRRGEALRPAERLAAVLSGRESVGACEALVLRARSDLDAGRVRESALQLRVGLEALLAERELFLAPGQDEDLAALEGRRVGTGEAANEALRGDLSPAREAEVAETLRLCERVLRRRRALG